MISDTVPKWHEIQNQLSRILRTDLFSRKPILKKFLPLLTNATLSSTELGEYEVGTAILDKKDDWIQINDRVAAVHKSNLSTHLKEYYAGQGKDDLVILSVQNREMRILARYNPDAAVFKQRSYPMLAVFGAELHSYFDEAYAHGERCVVTGDAAEWHPLDGDVCNNALGNLIPLRADLCRHLEHTRTVAGRVTLPLLDASYLAEVLAPQYFAQWQTGRAYGCALLAFHLGQPPYGQELPDTQLKRLRYVFRCCRHRYNERIIGYLIRHHILPLVASMESLDPESAYGVGLEVTSLLDEAEFLEDAREWFEFTNGVAHKYRSLLLERGMSDFVQARRHAQLLCRPGCDIEAFNGYYQQALELARGNTNQDLILTNIAAFQAILREPPKKAARAYDMLTPIVDKYKRSVLSQGYGTRPDGVDAANLANAFLYWSVAACRVQPEHWRRDVPEALAINNWFMDAGGSKPSFPLWEKLSTSTYQQFPSSMAVLQLLPQYVRPGLNPSIRQDLAGLRLCLRRIAVKARRAKLSRPKSPG